MIKLSKYLSRSEVRLAGIYFIILKNRIVYIGKSVNVFWRLSSHEMLDFKEWDSVRVIPCELDKLNEYEVRWIKRFKPEYNHRHVRRYVWNGCYPDVTKRTKELIN